MRGGLEQPVGPYRVHRQEGTVQVRGDEVAGDDALISRAEPRQAADPGIHRRLGPVVDEAGDLAQFGLPRHLADGALGDHVRGRREDPGARATPCRRVR